MNYVPKNRIVRNPLFSNSVSYGASSENERRSTGSEYEFTYSGTYLRIHANVSQSNGDVGIFVDNSYTQTVSLVDGVKSEVTLASGSKTVKIVEGRCQGRNLGGVKINSIVLEDDNFTKIDPSNVSERFVFLGDSIPQGVGCTNQFTDSYPMLLKYTDTKNVTVLGSGGLRVEDISSTTDKINTTVSWITSAFNDTTTTKKLVIGIGLNDYLNGVSAASVETYFSNLLDAINTSDSSIEIFVLTPLTCSTEASGLDDIRTALSNACSGRAYCTVINGKTILTYPTDFNDANHPSTSGNLIVYNSIKSTITA